MPTVCAVTVTYGNRFEAFCKPTIERALRAGVNRVIVVDNGSDRCSEQLLRTFDAECPRITLVRRERNEGSAFAFGLGLSAASDTGAEFIWLLDDDNWVEPGTLRQLLHVQTEAAERIGDHMTAVCASREPNGFHQRVRAGASVASVYPPAGAFLSFDLWTYLRRHWSRPQPLRVKSPNIPYAPYGGLLIRNELIPQIGLPCKDFVLYSDDTHWTSEIVRCGYNIVLATDVAITDADAKWLTSNSSNSVASMMQKNEPVRLYLTTRNRVYFDYGRVSHILKRTRYSINRLVIMTVAWLAARRHRSIHNFTLFCEAIRDAEAGDLSQSPRLEM